MSKTGLLLALMLVSCGFLIEDFANPALKPDYVSECGAKFHGTDHAGFQAAERRAVVGLAGVLGPDICDAMKDFVVSTVTPDAGFWVPRSGGLSGCDSSPGQNGWAVVLPDWHEISYFHEVAHHMQCPREDANHIGWEESGLSKAIRDTATEGKL